MYVIISHICAARVPHGHYGPPTAPLATSRLHSQSASLPIPYHFFASSVVIVELDALGLLGGSAESCITWSMIAGEG